MPDPQVEEANPVVDYISSKYYNGENKAELSQKFSTDKSALEKAIAETHVKYGKQGQTLGEFENDYYSKYGNPFAEKKKPTSSQPLQKNQEQSQGIPTVEESKASYKPKVLESGNGSVTPSGKDLKANI